jgi:hypothetical protein
MNAGILILVLKDLSLEQFILVITTIFIFLWYTKYFDFSTNLQEKRFSFKGQFEFLIILKNACLIIISKPPYIYLQKLF